MRGLYAPPRSAAAPLETTWDEVFQAALGVELPEPIDHRHRVTVRPVAMEDKVTLILQSVREAARIEFSRLLAGIDGIQAKMHGVMTLLASLELTRRREIYLRQVDPFSELWVYPRPEDERGPAAVREDGPDNDPAMGHEDLPLTGEPEPVGEAEES